MPELKDLLKESRLTTDEINFVLDKAQEYKTQGMDENAANLAAVKFLRESAIDTLEDMFNQLDANTLKD